MSNINQYPLTATQINDEDFYDVDYWNGATYETRKISGANLKAAIGALYLPLAGGTMTGDITINGNDLIGGLTKIYMAGTDFRAESTSSGTSMRLDSANGQVQFFDNTYIHRLEIRALGATQAYTWDMPLSSGTVALVNDITTAKNQSSTQWSKTLGTPSSLPNGAEANGFTFFDNVADKSSGGTTTYDEYDISYGISLLFTGTSGSGTIVINSVGYGITFNVDLPTTITDFINTNGGAILNDADVRIFQVGDNMRFCGGEAVLNGILYTQNAADLSATLQNEFTGLGVAAGDHVVIPYVGELWENKRLHHLFRVNFDLVTGSDQTLALSLRRYANDSVIGSEIPIFRNQDVAGIQQTFASYTASSSDPFVTGGFYFALRNDSGVTVEIDNSVGILIQNTYETPIIV